MYAKIALGNVRRSLRDFSIFFLTIAFGVCVFYAFGSITEQNAAVALSQDERETVQVLADMLSGVSVLVVIIFGFLVVYANRFLIRRRKREFGIYLTLGMDLSRVSLIVIMETLIVGLGALVVGLVCGFGLSQLMMYVTARLFETTITKFTLVFSPAACLSTVLCFAGIFLVSLVFNVSSIARYKLIDLINADRVSEKVKIRSLPVSVLLFVASLVLIGVAYWVLLKWGMLSEGPYFAIATGLVTVGTLLFFFSISGFLLRLVQSSKRVYLSGLNMFVLRQLNSRVNTAWLSISLVCAMLFIAICGVCTGFSVATSFNEAVSTGTTFDASLISYPDGISSRPEHPVAEEYGYDAAAKLREDIPTWDSMVRASTQVDLFAPAGDDEGISVQWLMDHTDYDGSSLTMQALRESAGSDNQVEFVRVSQFNALREMVGKEPLELGADECVFWNNTGSLSDFFRAVAEQNPTLTVFGRELAFADQKVVEDPLNDSTSGTVAGVLVVPDDAIPANAVRGMSVVNVMYAGERADVEPAFVQALKAAYGENTWSPQVAEAWPVWNYTTAEGLLAQTNGTTVTVTYLAIYIGVILLVSCASVLALQQLSEAADNVGRYRVFSELGAERSLVHRALATQIGIYFLFPLVVAVCHAAVALSVVNDIVALLTGYQIGEALVVTVGFVLVLYGGYFAVTYATSRGMLLRPTARA